MQSMWQLAREATARWMKPALLGAALSLGFGAQAAAQNVLAPPVIIEPAGPTYFVSYVRLAPFTPSQINETQVTLAEVLFELTVLGDDVPEHQTHAFLNDVARSFGATIRVRTGATDVEVGSHAGVTAATYDTTEGGSPERSRTNWVVKGSAFVEVEGAKLVGLDKSLLDWVLPMQIPVYLAYEDSQRVSRTNSSTVAFLPRITYLYQAAVGAAVLIVLYLLWILFRISRRNRAMDDEVLELRVRAEDAERTVERMSRVGSVEGVEDVPDVPLPDVPRRLADAIAQNRAMVAYGAGASAQAGLPTSFELLFELGDRFKDHLSERLLSNVATYVRQEGRKPDPELFENVIKAIETQVSRDRLVAAIGDIIAARHHSSSGIYRRLAGIGWGGVLSLVWDTLGEEAFRKADTPYQFVGPRNPENMRRAIQNNENLFVRGRGGLDDPANLVLTFDDFRAQFENRPEYRQQMVYLLQDRSFFFVGVSLATLREYLTTLDPYLEIPRGQHFVLAPASFENELFVRPLEQYGIELIEYSPANGYAQAVDFLDELRIAARLSSVDRRDNETRMSQRRWAPITGLQLKNIGPFDHLEMDLAQMHDSDVEAKGAPWTVITGQNGAGKSIVLRSIAVALSAHDDRIQRHAGSLLKYGRDEGQIALTIGDQTYHVGFVRDNSSADGVRVTSRQQSPLAVGASLTLGFPALRGAPSGDPVGPRALKPQRATAKDVYPLALDGVDDRMLDFKQWVVNVLVEADKGNAKFQRLVEVLDDIISEILPGGVTGLMAMRGGNDYTLRVRIQDPQHPDRHLEMPFDQLSQGMSSVFNWIGVFLQRLHENFDELDDLTQAPATVMVDEIDVHLHPEWQRRVVMLVKGIFPNVQVIASTHSALIVSSVYAAEVRVFQGQETGDVKLVRPVRETFGRSATDLLQGPALDVQNARSAEIDGLIVRYNDLLQEPKRSDEEEDDFYELRAKLQDVGWEGILDEPAPKLSAADIQRLNENFPLKS